MHRTSKYSYTALCSEFHDKKYFCAYYDGVKYLLLGPCVELRS